MSERRAEDDRRGGRDARADIEALEALVQRARAALKAGGRTPRDERGARGEGRHHFTAFAREEARRREQREQAYARARELVARMRARRGEVDALSASLEPLTRALRERNEGQELASDAARLREVRAAIEELVDGLRRVGNERLQADARIEALDELLATLGAWLREARSP